MASVTVFVDDAVLGNLSPVCVIDGVPTDDALTITQQVGNRTGLGVAWLLVLAGPLGWLGLIVISAFKQSGEALTVTLPFSEAAYLRRGQAERARLMAGCCFRVLGSTNERLPALGPRAGRDRRDDPVESDRRE
jgi:hypothetical protein